MSQMIDALLYVPDFTTLVGYMDEHFPDCLVRDGEGAIAMPPVITGFARTPAAMGPDGNSLMVYARLREHEVEQWENTPGVEVLGQAEYTGKGTGQAVYDQVFSDTDKAAKYDSVYDRSEQTVDDGEGGTTTVTPPPMFGLLAGA